MSLRRTLNLFAGGFALGGVLAVLLWTVAGCAPASKPETKVVPSTEPPAPAALSSNKTKEVTKLVLPADRTVFITGPIMSMDSTIRKIVELGQSSQPLYVVLNSPGGSVLDGAMLISAIEAAKGPVYTVCNQLCASMAAIIFEYGTGRYAVDRSFLMFHPASGGSEGEVDKMVSRLSSIQRYIGKMEAYIAKRAGLSFERYKQLSGVELWVDAEDAVNSGFADKIVSVVLPDDPTSMIPLFGGSANATATGLPLIHINPMSRNFDFTWGTK